MDKADVKDLKKNLGDIKSLLILLLQNMKVDNEKIGRSMGLSKGSVSKLIDKIKYPRG